MSDIVYAIDFGTSNTLLAGAKQGQAFQPIDIDPRGKQKSILRSLMYYPLGGEPSFGQSAIDQYSEEYGEGRFLRSIKKFLPMESFKGTRINNKHYSLEDLIGRFLRELKQRADQNFNEDVTSVVLGRPARFSMDADKDRLAQSRLQAAAEAAGFKQVSFFAEPLAAAFDYRRQIDSEKLVLVVDLGGGTSDFTVIRLRPSGFSDQDVLGLGGVSVAGDAMDGSIMKSRIAHHFGAEVRYKMPMSNNVLEMPPMIKEHLSSPADITLMSRQDIQSFLVEVRKASVEKNSEQMFDQLSCLISENLGFPIFEEIESAKRQACSQSKARFCFQRADIDVVEEFNYQDFLNDSRWAMDKIFVEMDEVLAQAGVSAEQVDSICMTGGTSKIPAVKNHLQSRFGASKLATTEGFHSVIQGLAERAQDLQV